MNFFSQGSMMQEHRKHVQEEDNWKCTNVYFENVLNLKFKNIYVIS
jgi:hypothetical protein